MALRTFTCPHCGANMMIEIGRKKAVCEYCDSELYIDEIVSDIKRDRNRDDREDENKVHHSGTHTHTSYSGGSQSGSYQGGAYSGGTYDNRTQEQNYHQGYSTRTADMNVSPKSRLLALLLCFFLGVLGVHRFYVGKVGTGILYFFTASLFGFGWIYDMIMIAIGAFRDSRGLPLINWEV